VGARSEFYRQGGGKKKITQERQIGRSLTGPFEGKNCGSPGASALGGTELFK